MKSRIGALALAAIVSLSSLPALAEFPERTIENIFPWSAGGAMASSQIIAAALGEELDTTVTVISTPGAAGTKAFKTAINRPADGYTIFDGYVAPLVLQSVLGNVDWTYKDFIPLHGTVSNAFSIGTRVGDDRWKNFEEMMAFGKANPGELRYSSGASNTLPHMVIAKVLQGFGVVAQNIPYKTDGDARKDLKAGILDFAFVNVSTAMSDPDGFKIVLVLSELEAAKNNFGGAPSIADLGIDVGLSGLAPMGWSWWLVHKDTPAAEVKILQDALARVMAREDITSKLSAMGFVPLPYGPSEYEAIVGPVSKQLESMGNALKWERKQLEALN